MTNIILFNSYCILFAVLILEMDIQSKLSYRQQLKTTILISIAFMLVFMSYTSVQGIVTKFYQSNGHEYYGKISLIIIYTFFALSTTYSSSIIKALGYKIVFIAGTLCYTILSSSALIIYFTNSETIAIITIIVTSILCGIAAGNIWVAQNAYLGEISSSQNLSQMFGIFEGIRSFAVIIGYIMTFYVFKYYDGFTFFSILIPLGLASVVIFCILPVPDNSQKYKKIGSNLQGFQKIKTYFKLLTIKENYQIYVYECLNSCPQTILSVFTYKIVDSSIMQQTNQNDYDYNQRLTYILGFTLLWSGLSRCLFSFLTKKITDNMNCYQYCYLTAVSSIVAIIIGAISYYLSSIWICCLFTFLLGQVYATSRNSCNLLLKQVFKNDLDLIGINYMVSSFSFIANIFFLSFLAKISINICLLVYFFIFTYIAYCAKNILKIKDNQKIIEMTKIGL